MKATIWKAVFAAMSPSPVFAAIAEFAELRVEQQRKSAAHAEPTTPTAFPSSRGRG
jgi:hypothetical protein